MKAEPVKLFLEILAALDEKDRAEASYRCCVALGERGELIGTPAPDRPIGEFFRFPGFDDLGKRLDFVTNQAGIEEYFLIPALFNHLLEWFEQAADSGELSERIDYHLQILSELREDLKKPIEQRVGALSDDQIRDLIAMTEDLLGDKPARRANAELLVGRLHRERDIRFPEGYWKDYESRRWLNPNRPGAT